HKFHLENEKYILFSLFKKAEEKEGDMVGYAMVEVDLLPKTYLLRRIAFREKDKGYGRSALCALIKHCFDELELNRFYLDVYPHNKRAIYLYEDIGLVWEGTLRENYYYDGVFLDQRLYSMLKREYKMTPLYHKSYQDL
ncbi:MAG TPA: GNAT family protein, partial [Clostridia bacterium]|nr:GNAT family protein [Clostridia bacterium]